MDSRTTDTIIERECRRLIHDDRDAEEIALDIQKRGVPDDGNVRQHIYGELEKRWDPIPDWDDPAFLQVLKAVVNPTDLKVAGFEAAKTAYDLLEYPEQDILKFKGIEGLSEETIAEVSRTPLNQVKREATSAKATFWKLFTRERWSTLAYFIEKLCEDADSSATDILKVESEFLAAQAAYNSLDGVDKEVLRQRCVKGRAIEAIASEQQTSPREISETLANAREEFYDKFLTEIFHLQVSNKRYESQTDKDSMAEALTNLQERLYKFVPENYQGWLTKSAKSVRHDAEKKENRRGRIVEKRGRVYINPEGESVYVGSPTADSLEPHKEMEKEETERKEERFWKEERSRWHQLLTKTAMAILRSKKPEKKLFLLIHYILQPKLNALRTTQPSAIYEYQHPVEAMAITDVLDRYQSKKATQAEIGDVIDATDRSIRRYIDEILPLVKRYAKEVGIKEAALVQGCAPIKESDVKKVRD